MFGLMLLKKAPRRFLLDIKITRRYVNVHFKGAQKRSRRFN